MKQSPDLKTLNNKDIQEPIMAEKIELLIQLINNITIPSIVFEYISNKEADFEINDLKNFYTSFGEVIDFIIKDKISIVLYKTFFSANALKEFLLNENNFKDNMKKNFLVKWFDIEKDINILPNDLQKLFKEIHNKNIINLINYNKINISNTNEKMINDINSNNNNINKINENFDLLNNNINSINNNNIININKVNNNQIDYNIIGNQNLYINYISPNQIMQYNQIKMKQPLILNNINNSINNKVNNNINHNMNNNINNNSNKNIQNLNLINYISNLNELSNSMPISSINIPLFLNNQNNIEINNIMDKDLNINNINNYQYNQNKNNIKQYINNNNQNFEEKNYGRYTCKYRILIPNDKDFQIARKLIGSKGYNMKKIVNECCKNSNNNRDNVKLRLRGKGSGFKEGIENKESDEPLHLCISAKNQEEMNKACKLVENLLNKIYEDYKIYCFKNNIIPNVNQIAIRIDGGNSLQKNK